ncbi:galactoside alpha-(1,2)-fucosyltransferase 2-like [Babylonia areolata]|uniref:galactoside alpha-(1,2)-fucosyltransferase 2-like n=1 Tax=Babylonia areolata TaxID=304850 RepID=UPI003FD19C54
MRHARRTTHVTTPRLLLLPLLRLLLRAVPSRRKSVLWMAALLLCLTLLLVLATLCAPSILTPTKHPQHALLHPSHPPKPDPHSSVFSPPQPRPGGGGPFTSHSGPTVPSHAARNSSQVTGPGGRRFVTVIPRGRLGNQMFQYASLLGIADVNDREPFVSSSCRVTHYFANVSVSDRPVSGWGTVEELNYAEKDSGFDSLPVENVRLKGFFQSWKYFASVSHKVKRAFVFLPDVEQAVRRFFANSTGNVSHDVIKIGVHVRRTDMLHKATQKQGYVPAPLSYIHRAIQHMRVRFGNQSTFFFVVSDDPEWCRQHVRGHRVRIVDPAPSVVHLGFLALCDHVIMTVGTFGWWAAFLSGGHVVYYAGFPRAGSEIAEGFNKHHFYLPAWVAIGD